MLILMERAHRPSIADRLIELYTQRAEACGSEDWHRLRMTEQEIHDPAAQRPAVGDGADPSEQS